MNMLRGIGVLCFSLLAILQWGEGGDTSSLPSTKSKAFCSCKKPCQIPARDENSLEPSTSSASFYFDSALNSCLKVPSLCKLSADCTFAAQSTCESWCVVRSDESKDKEGAEKSNPDTKASEGIRTDCENIGNSKTCRHMDKHSNLPSSSAHGSVKRGVRWDMVVGGTCVMVVLVAALTVVGVVTYNYRIKKKERVRSQYIRDVLEMYDSTSDSSLSEGEQHWKEANSRHVIRL